MASRTPPTRSQFRLRNRTSAPILVIMLSFIAVSAFAIKRSKIASESYFLTKFLNERYSKSVELARMQNEQLNLSVILEEAHEDRFSKTNKLYKIEPTQNIGFCKPKIRNGIKNPTENVFCTFNKKVVISHLHKKYPSINWEPVEDIYRLKKRSLWLYRLMDWAVQYSSIVILFWLLPLSALWVLARIYKTQTAENRD